MPQKRPAEERFWKKVEKTDGYIVSHAEARTWKTIENRARTAIANAKVQHAGENKPAQQVSVTQKEGD